jgi:hypothetical protein
MGDTAASKLVRNEPVGTTASTFQALAEEPVEEGLGLVSHSGTVPN